MVEIQKQRFLFVPDFGNELDTYNKVCRQFTEKFYGTDATLFIMVDNNSDAIQYYFYWAVRTFESSHIRYVLSDKCGVEFLQQVDYFITGCSSKSDSFIDFAYKNRIKIISAQTDNVFSEFCPSDAVIRMKEEIKKALDEQIFSRIPLDRYEYIVFHQGMGETLCFLYWMKEYVKYNRRPIAVFCMQESRKDLLELCPFISYVVTVSPLLLAYIYIYCGESHGIKNFNGLYDSNQNPWEMKSNWCMVDTVREFLNLPQEAELERYDITIPGSAEANADLIFEKLHLRKGHTVFVVHNGIKFGDGVRNDAFWKRLVKVLKDNGYDVVFNGTEEVYGCPGIFCSIHDTVRFAEKCGNVISVSTGLTEAICALSTNPVLVQFVWHGAYDPIWTINEIRCELTHRDIKQFGTDFVQGEIDTQRAYENQVFSKSVESVDYILDMEPEKMEELVQTLVDNVKNREL